MACVSPETCPFLPLPDRDYTHHDIHALGADRSERFYIAALNYAQTLWLHGFPAKALLLINRALSCSLPDVPLHSGRSSFVVRPLGRDSALPDALKGRTTNDDPLTHRRPYHAIAWLLLNRSADQFIGNPRRHYQHLATRMVEPHKELRTWRAWACWYLAKQLLREDEHPPDAEQVRKERIVKPRRQEIAAQLRALSPCDDAEAWESALAWVHPWFLNKPTALTAPATIRIIGADEVHKVQALAHEIWPLVYPSIITMEQIDYMLADRYEVRTLQREIIERGVVYALIECGAQSTGYIAYEEIPQDRSAFLHKLYLKPEYHSLGIGAQALRWVENEARQRQLTRIGLRVNKQNLGAIRAYMREDYLIERELVTDIGGGFVMDDYVMMKLLG